MTVMFEHWFDTNVGSFPCETTFAISNSNVLNTVIVHHFGNFENDFLFGAIKHIIFYVTIDNGRHLIRGVHMHLNIFVNDERE